MANGLSLNSTDMSSILNEWKNRANKRQEPNISLGEGMSGTVSGTQTVSQDKAKFFSELDPKKLTLFEKSLLGGDKAIKEEKKKAEQLIASETIEKPIIENNQTEDSAIKEDNKLQPKRLWRVMFKDSKIGDQFAESKEEAENILKKSGKQGAVAGIRFDAPTKERQESLITEYKSKAKGVSPAEDQISKRNALYDFQRKQQESAVKRYEDELASRGMTTPKTREEERQFNRIRMEDFRLSRAARQSAERAEKSALADYNNIKRAERAARRQGDYTLAARLASDAEDINDLVGGDIRNRSATKRFFTDQANQQLSNEIRARIAARQSLMKKKTSANPEAASFD
jgi:hypothetical protein